MQIINTYRTNMDDLNTDQINIKLDDGDSNGQENNLNSTQTNDLLNLQHGKIDQFLQQVYYSQNFQYFYLGLILLCLILIFVTIIDGFKVADSPLCIVIEFILCVTVTIDFAIKVRLTGFKNYLMKNKFWNKFDFAIVVGCNILFLLTLLSKASVGEEISEEILLISWCIA